jgi:hypothetical protein
MLKMDKKCNEISENTAYENNGIKKHHIQNNSRLAK